MFAWVIWRSSSLAPPPPVCSLIGVGWDERAAHSGASAGVFGPIYRLIFNKDENDIICFFVVNLNILQ